MKQIQIKIQSFEFRFKIRKVQKFEFSREKKVNIHKMHDWMYFASVIQGGKNGKMNEK